MQRSNACSSSFSVQADLHAPPSFLASCSPSSLRHPSNSGKTVRFGSKSVLVYEKPALLTTRGYSAPSKRRQCPVSQIDMYNLDLSKDQLRQIFSPNPPGFQTDGVEREEWWDLPEAPDSSNEAMYCMLMSSLLYRASSKQFSGCSI